MKNYNNFIINPFKIIIKIKFKIKDFINLKIYNKKKMKNVN